MERTIGDGRVRNTGYDYEQTDGFGNTTRTTYDNFGRVTSTIDALGYATTSGYDALGRQTSVTDPLTNAVTTAYDAEGRVVSQRGATYPVDYTYDAYGNKVSMTTYRNESDVPMVGGDVPGAPHAGDTTRWLYDEPSGCMTNKLYADGKGPSYTYTPDGKLSRRVWARGIATDYTYDNAGNLTRTEYDDNGVTPTITMSYDRVGNLINATTAGVVTNLYAYDLYGHCTNEWQNDFEIARFHDSFGRPAGYAADGERRTTLAYDACGRLATMEMGSHGQFTWTYHAGASLKAALAYPNGLVASWAYDAENRLAQVRNATPSGVISQFDYAYDAAGRRIAVTRSGTAFGDLSGATDRYAYNARGEVTGARRTNGGQPVQGFSEDFAYDPIGNRTSSATYDEAGEAQVSTYVANALNQYVSRTTPGFAAVRGEADSDAAVTVNGRPAYRLGAYFFGGDVFDNSASGGFARLETYAALAQADADGNDADDLVSSVTGQVYVAQSPEAFAYDADGNQTLVQTATGIWQVQYNGENRPVLWENVSTNSPTFNSTTPSLISMSYDHMGRRRTKDGQRFFYDGYLQVANERTVSNAVVRQSFVWDPTEPVATRPLTWQRGNSAAYYVVDGNKNVSEVVDSDGSLAAHYEYAPFGAVILQRGESAATNPWRFSSEYAEDDTATIYYNYRHYEPVMGRWLSRDPVGEEDGLNIYVFIDNGLDVDSLGLVKFDSTCDSIKSNCEGEFKDIIDELGKIAAKYIPEKFPDNDIPGESPREKKRRRKEWIAEHKDDPLWKAILDVYDKYGLIEHKKNGDKIFRTIWRTSEAMRKGFGQVKDDFEKGSTIITCCPDKMSGLCDSDDPRFKTSGGYLPYSDAGIFASAYRGKIVVCPSLMGKGGFDKHGGCGCFIMHELMHKYGMRIPRKDKPRELAIENAMIEIQRIILGAFSKHVCKGYDVN